MSRADREALVQAALEAAKCAIDELWDSDAPVTRMRCLDTIDALDPAAIAEGVTTQPAACWD